jgi:hypothetical protein
MKLLFKNTEIICADNYVMRTTYVCDNKDVIDIINAYGVEQIIISPAHKMIRITLRGVVRGINTNVVSIIPSPEFLEALKSLDIREMNSALDKYKTREYLN